MTAITGLRPEPCAVPECSRIGQALLERYEPEDDSPYGFNRPTGEWIWLCDEHTREEFA